jgi:hypothetical protein
MAYDCCGILPRFVWGQSTADSAIHQSLGGQCVGLPQGQAVQQNLWGKALGQGSAMALKSLGIVGGIIVKALYVGHFDYQQACAALRSGS